MSDHKDMFLQTENLTLREFREDDWQAVHIYGCDPEVVKYLPFGPNTEPDTREFIKRVLASQKDQPRLSYNFAIVCKGDNKLIGSCRIRISQVEYQEGEIGYVLNRHFWNRGYMSEAVRQVVSFGFEQLGLHRIFATCDPANTGSYRVMEKIRMQKEGYLRKYKRFKGIWRDFLLYSLLESEWREQREALLKKDCALNTNVQYLAKDQEKLDLIQPLWEKLVEHHRSVARYYRDHYPVIPFAQRKKQLLEKTWKGALRVDLAVNQATGENIGYCVTSVNREKQGMIESIYVEKDYRGSGVGDRLMTRALGWLETLSVKNTILGVREGNESVFAFYRRYNFYPRTTILEQKRLHGSQGELCYEYEH